MIEVEFGQEKSQEEIKLEMAFTGWLAANQRRGVRDTTGRRNGICQSRRQERACCVLGTSDWLVRSDKLNECQECGQMTQSVAGGLSGALACGPQIWGKQKVKGISIF